MIDSVNNEKIIFYKKLRDSKYIKEYKKYIVEGKTLVYEAYKAGLLLEVLTCEECDLDIPKVLMSKKCLEKISLLKSTPFIMGVVKIKEDSEIKGNKIILLDKVQDPGNAGTIIRSALAFNVSTIIFSLDCVNLFNDKLIRSTEGTIFHSNTLMMDLEEAIKIIKEKNVPIFYADMKGNILLDNLDTKSYALVMGNEGQGVSEKTKKLCDDSISIPMNDLCESLNVGVSASIMMYNLR